MGSKKFTLAKLLKIIVILVISIIVISQIYGNIKERRNQKPIDENAAGTNYSFDININLPNGEQDWEKCSAGNFDISYNGELKGKVWNSDVCNESGVDLPYDSIVLIRDIKPANNSYVSSITGAKWDGTYYRYVVTEPHIININTSCSRGYVFDGHKCVLSNSNRIIFKDGYFIPHLDFINHQMEKPIAYGWFHIVFLIAAFVVLFILYNNKNHNEKELKWVLGIYGVSAFVLEFLKQLLWSYNFKTNIWSYGWYYAPFQFCTMPMYICLVCLFLKNTKLRKALLSFVAFYAMLSGILIMIMPEFCFCTDTLVNIHTIYLHCGSFVVAMYLLMHEIKPTKENLISAFYVFITCVIISLILDIVFYKTGIIGDAVFNMFFVSPYFPSTLPIFDKIYVSVPYVLFLIIYIVLVVFGSWLVYYIAKDNKKYNENQSSKDSN